MIYNEDCMKIMAGLPDESIDLIVTDPPYRVTSKGSAGNTGGMLQKAINKSGKVFKFNDIECEEYAPEFFRLLKDGSHCYVMTNHVNLINMLNTFTGVGFHFIKSLIWNKGNKIMGQYYMSQFEYILFFRKGKGVKINNCGTSDIISIPNKKTKDADGNNIHDTEKPVALMKVLIENSSKEGDTVLDPFLGVGASGIAAAALHREFIGTEIDENYFNIAKARIEEQCNKLTRETQRVKKKKGDATNDAFVAAINSPVFDEAIALTEKSLFNEATAPVKLSVFDEVVAAADDEDEPWILTPDDLFGGSLV